jgi:hypothetical protein
VDGQLLLFTIFSLVHEVRKKKCWAFIRSPAVKNKKLTKESTVVSTPEM